MTSPTWSEQVFAEYDALSPWDKMAVAGGIILAVFIPYKFLTTGPRKTPIKEDYKKGMVYLYQFPRVKCIPNLSPYCLKLETWLRMADIPYEIVADWRIRSLEGTLPFIEYNGKEYPDSGLAIRDMTKIFSKESMEMHLSDEQQAISLAFERMAERSLYETVALVRYAAYSDEVFDQLPDNCFGFWTPILKWNMKRAFVQRVINRVITAGIGKHKREEIVNMANDDLKAISWYLGSKHYLIGFKPTRVDAALFGVLAQIVYAPYDLPQKAIINHKYSNLKEYVERIKDRYWPDWEDCTTKFTINTEWKKKKCDLMKPDSVQGTSKFSVH